MLRAIQMRSQTEIRNIFLETVGKASILESGKKLCQTVF